MEQSIGVRIPGGQPIPQFLVLPRITSNIKKINKTGMMRLGERGEEAFDRIEPACRGRREVEVEAWMAQRNRSLLDQECAG